MLHPEGPYALALSFIPPLVEQSPLPPLSG